MNRDIISEPIEFEWDSGNIDKNTKKHGINNEEAESIFFDGKSVFLEDQKHSNIEDRCQILGKSNLKNLLSIVFTIRKTKIRIISARFLNKKEKKLYEKQKNKQQS